MKRTRSLTDAHAIVALDRLLGRTVVDRDGRSAGRIAEFRVDTDEGEWRIAEYVLGVGGWLERLNVGFNLVLGGHLLARVAAVDQMDISDPEHPRLTCRRDELRNA